MAIGRILDRNKQLDPRRQDTYYIAMKPQLTIVKVGGAVLENNEQLDILLHNFASITHNKLLVHGGGRKATQIATQLNIETQMVEGRRITNQDMLDVVTMVYGGLINKTVVAKMQAMGMNAIGLTGADVNLIKAHKRPVSNGVDYGFVGNIDQINANSLATLLNSCLIPVIAPLSHNGKGQILNTNADTIAAETAKAMAKHFDVTLIYCFEKNGVLLNPDDENSVIPYINRQTFNEKVEQGIISAGMIPKLNNSLEAIENGVSRVVITSAIAPNWQKGTIVL